VQRESAKSQGVIGVVSAITAETVLNAVPVNKKPQPRYAGKWRPTPTIAEGMGCIMRVQTEPRWELSEYTAVQSIAFDTGHSTIELVGKILMGWGGTLPAWPEPPLCASLIPRSTTCHPEEPCVADAPTDRKSSHRAAQVNVGPVDQMVGDMLGRPGPHSAENCRSEMQTETSDVQADPVTRERR